MHIVLLELWHYIASIHTHRPFHTHVRDVQPFTVIMYVCTRVCVCACLLSPVAQHIMPTPSTLNQFDYGSISGAAYNNLHTHALAHILCVHAKRSRGEKHIICRGHLSALLWIKGILRTRYSNENCSPWYARTTDRHLVRHDDTARKSQPPSRNFVSRCRRRIGKCF